MRCLWLILTVCLLLSVVPALAQDDNLPFFSPAECMFERPADFEYVVECGYLSVPESRKVTLADDTNTIQLAVAVFRSFSPNPEPDPVIYLDGGPGGETLVFAGLTIDDFAPFLETRDVIMFDQRGVGFSQPHLDCAAATALSYQLLGLNIPDEEEYLLSREVYLNCREELAAQGVNFYAYNTQESAFDVYDLATALGYEQVNLFGISYGTRLGLVVMRDFPEIVRSAVLDAVYPPEINSDVDLVLRFDRVFSVLFDGCAQDEACNERYPDLRRVFFDTVDRLNAQPERVLFFDRFTNVERNVVVDGDLLVSTLFRYLYSTLAIPNLPRIIYEASEGQYDAFIDRALLDIANSEFFSESMYYAVECYEETAFSTFEEAEAAAANITEAYAQSLLASIRDGFEFCSAWIDGRAPDIANEPVISAVPALVTVGEYDPVTPPSYAEQAAANLSNSYFYVFPGVGHSAFYGGECPAGIITAFIANPFVEPDASCIAEMLPPLFVAPEITEVNLIPITNTQLGFTAVAPEGWRELEPGYFTPYPSIQIPVLAYRFPPSLDEYVDRIIRGPAYSYPALPESTGTIEANGFTWSIYEVQNEANGVYSLFAFTESAGGRAFVIGVVARTPDEREFLRTAVFIPAIESFTTFNM